MQQNINVIHNPIEIKYILPYLSQRNGDGIVSIAIFIFMVNFIIQINHVVSVDQSFENSKNLLR